MEIDGNTVHWREGKALVVDVLRPLPTSVHLLNRAAGRRPGRTVIPASSPAMERKKPGETGLSGAGEGI